MTQPAKPGKRVPALIAVIGRNVIDGMKIWGQIYSDEMRLHLAPFTAESMATATKSTPKTVRVEVRSEEEGATFLLFDEDALVLVECPPNVDEQYGRHVRRSALPDHTVTGPCQMQATFMCTGEAAEMRLIPTSILPDSLIPGPLYALMCLPCYEHLCTVYLTILHGGASA